MSYTKYNKAVERILGRRLTDDECCITSWAWDRYETPTWAANYILSTSE